MTISDGASFLFGMIALISAIVSFKKNREYRLDERGQMILAKASTIAMVGVSVAYLILIFSYNFLPSIIETIGFNNAFTLIPSVCFLANTIGIFYFERKY